MRVYDSPEWGWTKSSRMCIYLNKIKTVTWLVLLPPLVHETSIKKRTWSKRCLSCNKKSFSFSESVCRTFRVERRQNNLLLFLGTSDFGWLIHFLLLLLLRLFLSPLFAPCSCSFRWDLPHQTVAPQWQCCKIVECPSTFRHRLQWQSW